MNKSKKQNKRIQNRAAISDKIVDTFTFLTAYLATVIPIFPRSLSF